jgi:hypothetical protein
MIISLDFSIFNNKIKISLNNLGENNHWLSLKKNTWNIIKYSNNYISKFLTQIPKKMKNILRIDLNWRILTF